LGKLDETVAGTVSKHLELCAPCRQRVAELSGDSFVGRLRQAQPQPGEPAPRAKTLVEDVPQERSRSKVSDKQSSILGRLASSNDSVGVSQSGSTLPPELVNHPQYEVIRELGRGGMGVVYLARNKLMDRLEVLKLLSQEMLGKQERVDRFLREIQAAAKLHHPNVVAAYSAFPLGKMLVFAMEYVEGDDLAKLVRARGPLPVLNACYFAYQTAQGLQHAHERGMIHRDIKPGNLILFRQGKKGTVKILDFGLAKVTSEQKLDGTLTQQGQMLGTPDYIAPEQTLDAQKADIRSDIYSLGCTLYHLLTGNPPFSGNTLYAVLQAHHATEAKSVNLVRPEVPVELAAVVAKMMAKDPSRRYQTPAEVAQALKPFLKPGGLTKPQPELEPGVSKIDRPSSVPLAAAIPIADDDENPVLAPMQEVEASERWKSLIDTPSLTPSGARPAIRKPLRRWPIWFWPAAIAGALFGGLVIAWAAGAFSVKTKDGVIVLQNLPDNAEVLVDGEKVTVQLPDGGGPAQITVPPGKRGVQVEKDGFQAFGEEVNLTNGGKQILTVRLIPLPQGRLKQPEAAGGSHPVIADAERRFAQRVLSLGGRVAIRTTSQTDEVINADDGLPATAFRLVRVVVPDKRDLTDADLAGLNKLQNLIAINVAQAHRITDATLKELANLKQLEVIRVPGTATTDAGLSSLKDLTQLRILDLSHTQVTNAGLVNLQKLTNLETLYLGVTHVTGAGLADLEHLTGLRQLYFWDQNVGNTGVAHLKNLAQLEVLELVGANVDDEGLAHLKGLSKLRRLSLYHTGVTGSCFADPGALAQITWLDLHWTRITDANLAHLQRLPQLEFLNLDGTGITDAGLVHLHGLSKLKNLILTRTKVTGGGIEALRSSLVGCVIAADPVAVAPPPKVEKGGQSRRHSLGTPHFIRGDWKVENGELVQSSLGAWGDCPILVFGDNSLSSYNLTLDFKKTDGDDLIGAGFHWHGHDHFQLFALGAHQRFAELDSALNGQITWGDGLSKPFDVETDRWYAVRLEIRGPAYRCFVDDRMLFQHTDPRFSDGRLQLRTWSTTARFRNIKVTDPAGKVLLEGMPDLPGVEPAAAAPASGRMGGFAEFTNAPSGIKNADFAPLFNGKDFSNWTFPYGGQEEWTIGNGVIRGITSQGVGRMVSARSDYKDFHLRMEFRSPDQRNKFVIFRSNDVGGDIKYYSVSLGGLAFDNTTAAPGKHKFKAGGGILAVESLTTAGLSDLKLIDVPLLASNTWHTVDLEAVGNKFTLWISGQEVTVFRDDESRLRQGQIIIGLGKDAHAEIRKIEIKELAPSRSAGFGGGMMGGFGRGKRGGIGSRVAPNDMDDDTAPKSAGLGGGGFGGRMGGMGGGLGNKIGLGGIGFGGRRLDDETDGLGFGPPSKERFVRLFNGTDFTNWTFPKGGEDKWSIEDDVLRGDGMSRIATARTDFKDFHLRMRVRTPDQINKHLIFRSRDVDGNDANYRFHLGGMRYDHKSTWPLGSYTLLTGEPLKPGESGTTEGLVKLNSVNVRFLDDKWHRVEIFALRNVFRMKLDDREVSAFRDTQSRISDGQIMIGLVEGAHLELRDIEINEKLAKPPPAGPKKSPRKLTKPAAANDAFREGSVWKGSRTYRKGFWEGVTVDYEIQVLKRLGPKFTGVKFDNGAGRNRLPVEGEIHGQSLAWREGNEWRMVGKLDGDTITVQFHADFGNGKTEGSGQLKRSE